MSNLGSTSARFAIPTACVAAFLIGLDLAYMGAILTSTGFKEEVFQMPWDRKVPKAKMDSIIGFFSLGCVITALPVVSGVVANRWGSRLSIMLGSWIFLIGCIIQMRSSSASTMYIGRIVTGCSVGLISTVVPIYLADISSTRFRGGVLSLFQLMITLGIFIAILLDIFLVQIEHGWRMIIRLQTIPAAIVVVVMAFMPNSPRWLMQVGQAKEAENALIALHGPAGAGREIEDMMAEHMEDESAQPRSDLSMPRVSAMVVIGAALQVLHRLAGIHGIAYLGQRIFTNLGVEKDFFLSSTSAVMCASTLPAVFLADRFGRRNLLIFGSVCMAPCCIILGVLGPFVEQEGMMKYMPTDSAVVIILAIVVIAFMVCYSFTWGTIVWVYLAEMYPEKHRTWCLGATTTFHWVTNYLVQFFTPKFLDRFGFEAFFVFGVIQVIALFLAMWLPETNGVPLEKVNSLFDAKFSQPAQEITKGVISYGATATKSNSPQREYQT